MLRGYVLHTRPYRESSFLVNLLVDGQGRVDAIAHPGRGKRSIKGILQPFQPLVFQLSRARNLKKLYQIEAASPPIPISGDVVFAGLYLNELLMRCLNIEHGGEQFFSVYHQTLMTMAANFDQTQLRYFELELLKELGLMPSLSHDVTQSLIVEQGNYQLILEQGFEKVIDDREDCYHGQMLLALRERELASDNLKPARQVMRQLLSSVLGDRPLNSRQLYYKSIVKPAYNKLA